MTSLIVADFLPVPPTMSFSQAFEHDVVDYMRDMRTLRTNYWALYYPNPLEGKEIEIGDVGYVFEGSFRRLFSAITDKDDKPNSGRVPDDHKPLAFNMSTDVTIYDESKVILANTPCCSDRIKWEAIATDSETYV